MVVETETSGEEQILCNRFALNNVKQGIASSYQVCLEVNGRNCYFEVDTGVCKSIKSVRRFKRLIRKANFREV